MIAAADTRPLIQKHNGQLGEWVPGVPLEMQPDYVAQQAAAWGNQGQQDAYARNMAQYEQAVIDYNLNTSLGLPTWGVPVPPPPPTLVTAENFNYLASQYPGAPYSPASSPVPVYQAPAPTPPAQQTPAPTPPAQQTQAPTPPAQQTQAPQSIDPISNALAIARQAAEAAARQAAEEAARFQQQEQARRLREEAARRNQPPPAAREEIGSSGPLRTSGGGPAGPGPIMPTADPTAAETIAEIARKVPMWGWGVAIAATFYVATRKK